VLVAGVGIPSECADSEFSEKDNMGIFFGSPKIEGVDIDLDAVQPTEGELKMHDTVSEVLVKRTDIISQIEDYKGCSGLAKAAMGQVGKGSKTQDDDQSAEKQCFEALLASATQVQTFFQYSQEVATVFPQLLEFLSGGTEGSKVAGLDKVQALAIQLGKLLDFALRFDGLRMMRPALSNDFSYYRRLLPKYSSTHPDVEVKEDEASSMALFTAEPTPMTNVLIRTTLKVQETTPTVSLVLATMASSCLLMLKQKKFDNPDTVIFCTRAMTGAFVLFDHVDEIGAFNKKSVVDAKAVIMLLQKDFPEEIGLLNAIRYSTKNFNDAPDSVQSLFE